MLYGESVRVYDSMFLIEKYEKPFTMCYVQPAMQFIFVLDVLFSLSFSLARFISDFIYCRKSRALSPSLSLSLRIVYYSAHGVVRAVKLPVTEP